MGKLQVIDGIKVEKPNYIDMYHRMFKKNVNEMILQKESEGECNKELIKKVIFSGVRVIKYSKMSSLNYKYLLKKFQIIIYLQDLMKLLTPMDLMNIFPVTKEYDGKKTEMKDYFFTINRAKEIGLEKPIGNNILEFLYDYQNWDITFLIISSMSIMNKMKQIEGEKTLAEEYFEEEDLDTYTMHTDQQGKKGLMNNRTGETQKVKKPRPRYLRPVE
ncbi:TPA: hypothetical protein QC072_002369 [Bacillus cereus]|nr:hypothetical protein [Bacillus cereus]